MTETMIRWEHDNDGIVTLWMDDPNASANTINEMFKTSLASTVDRLEAECEDITGVVLTSAKKSFFAGGNLSSLQARGPEDAKAVFTEAETVKGLLRRLERLGRPVVAALNGPALGGGLEIALACHCRFAVNSPTLKVGLPEVTLGLLPGGGGVTRLVRMLGIERALTGWLLEGTARTAEQAHDEGIVDKLVQTSGELIPEAKAWIAEHRDDESAATKPWDRSGYSIPGGNPAQPDFARNLPTFPGILRRNLKGADLPAPKALLCAAVEGSQVDFDTASRIESRYFVDVVISPTSSAMIQAFFFDMQALRLGQIRPTGVEKRRVDRVGVLGAGMRGAAIAYACAMAGLSVVLKDVSLDKVRKGMEHCRILLQRQVALGALDQATAEEALTRVLPTDQTADLGDVDAVIEAVPEDFELKRKVLAEVEEVCGPEALVCLTTSALSITSLQRTTSRPADVIGLHFFSSADRMKSVEIVRGEGTSDETVARAHGLVQRIRKVPILVNDGRASYISRVYTTFLMEAAALLEDGVDPMVVERAATQAGFPEPPLAMFDEVSLNLTLLNRDAGTQALADQGIERAAQPGEVLVDRMAGEFERRGRASGGGFYEYPPGQPKRLWDGLRKHFAKKDLEISLKDVQDRYLFRMALETAACFEAGVLTDTASANVGGILGMGYPPATGGPATLMTMYAGGLAGFVARAEELADLYGERFRPGAWLRNRVEYGTLV